MRVRAPRADRSSAPAEAQGIDAPPSGTGAGGDAAGPGGLRGALRALEHRNYRLYFLGQGLSLIGSWMQRIALTWLVYRLTNSVLLLAVVGFAGQLPTFLLAPFAGVLVDRWNRHRVLVLTQALAMVQALLLAGLVLSGRLNIWHIFALSVLLAVINAFDMPARQAFVVEMIDRREDLGNAIALNSSLVNGARLLGPSIAGVLIALLGEGVCFLVNGLSYIAVIGALLAMRLPARTETPSRTRMVDGLREGVAYAFGFAPVRDVLLLLCVVSLMGVPYTVLMPVIAAETLHGGANTLGALTAATGVGALVGTIFLAARVRLGGITRMIAIAAGIFGTGLILFAFSPSLWLSLVVLTVVGFGMMVQMSASNTLLQAVVDDTMRGRLMSFYTMAFMGTAPLGSLLAGVGADRFGASGTLILGGVSCIVSALIFAARLPRLRPAFDAALAVR